MRALPMLILLAACGSDGNAPSCQQGVTAFYAAGCSYYELDGTAVPANEVIADCKATLGVGCDDELDDLLRCMDGVPNPAQTATDCDCSAPQDDLQRCLN